MIKTLLFMSLALILCAVFSNDFLAPVIFGLGALLTLTIAGVLWLIQPFLKKGSADA